MGKITVGMPDELEAALKRIAADRGVGESYLVREAVGELVRKVEPTRPRLPLFHSDDPTPAERFDEELAGFGVP